MNNDFDEEPPSYNHALQASLEPDNQVNALGRFRDATIASFERGELFIQAFRSQLDQPPPDVLVQQIQEHGLARVLHLDQETHKNQLFRHPLATSYAPFQMMDDNNTVRFWPSLAATHATPLADDAVDWDVTLQASHPFLASYAKLHYFEMRVEDSRPETVLSIGMTTRPYPLFRMPGWNRYSVGYHSDDGCKFLDDATGGQDYGPSWGNGDTVGCGYEPETGHVFFTLNGHMVGTAFSSAARNAYYASIGSDGPATVHVNFGKEPFLYSIGPEWKP